MASLGNPRTWIPYMSNKDCSKGFCSLYCPQWCYIVYPPPPPFQYPDDNSSPNFSPLVIAIIGILASAFLLVSYYALISKYCGRRELSQRESHDPNDELQDMNQIPSLHEPWHVSTTGLDESLIKSITVYKYKKGEGMVETTQCSVCLSEFEDDESVRLLPKCSHSFHLPCIDTWLKSHSTCPLCRASIFTFNASAPQVAAPIAEIELPSRNENETSSENQHEVANLAVRRGNDSGVVEEETVHAAKPELRAFSDLGNLQGRHSIIEIRHEVCDREPIRRSVSMDNCFQRGLFSVADVLNMNQEDDSEAEAYANNEAGTSKRSRGEGGSKSGYSKRRVLHCVLSPISMKRSFSSGRFLPGRNDTGRRQGIIPL